MISPLFFLLAVSLALVITIGIDYWNKSHRSNPPDQKEPELRIE